MATKLVNSKWRNKKTGEVIVICEWDAGLMRGNFYKHGDSVKSTYPIWYYQLDAYYEEL